MVCVIPAIRRINCSNQAGLNCVNMSFGCVCDVSAVVGASELSMHTGSPCPESECRSDFPHTSVHPSLRVSRDGFLALGCDESRLVMDCATMDWIRRVPSFMLIGDDGVVVVVSVAGDG